MTPFVCDECHYPSLSGDGPCDNPGCVANPTVTQAQKDIWARQAAEMAEQEAERQRLARLRRRAFAGY